MRARLTATALLLLASLGCGGRAATPAVSNPADRPHPTVAPPSATIAPPPATRLGPAPPPRAERLDSPLPTAPHDPAPPDGTPTGTPAHEVRHTLRHGQTLYSLARLYDIPIEELMAANGIRDPRSIPAGTKIVIPGARVLLPYRPAAAAGDRRDPDDPGGQGDGHEEDAVAAAEGGEAARERHAVRADPADSLLWPLRGAITGPFGRRGRNGQHTGIDIDGRRGDAILAAASGVVVGAGTDGPYGRRVEIDHGDGVVTLYAHADRLLVHAGERVDAGQRIAEVGRSGNARGTHLHFEVRRDGRSVDPMPLLRDRRLLTAGID